MRILYVAPRYDYGQPERGLSFEHYNFHRCLESMGHDVIEFDFPTLFKQRGRTAMNDELLRINRQMRPDLLFAVAYADWLDMKTMRKISHESDTPTLNWFCDDHWRFESFSRHWAPCFNWVVTTAGCAVAKYEAMGYANAIKSQWGCNHHLYQKLDLPLKYDVSFVGLPHGERPAVIQALRDAGINVECFGLGWPGGRVTQERMIEIFNQSRINLNFTASSVAAAPTPLQKWTDRWISRPLRSLPGGWRANALLPGFLRLKGPESGAKLIHQIKGRTFEVPGCGGFLLSGRADNLQDYYEDGREIGTFGSTAELIEKIRHYLNHEELRASAAEAGWRRTLSEHTYQRRFGDIFERMGLGIKAGETGWKVVDALGAAGRAA